MEITKLNTIIRTFWDNEHNSTRYFMGLCSEFTEALKQFLGTGTIYKAGWLHTCLKYKNHYCDIRGCYPEAEYRVVSPSPYLKQITPSERKHFKSNLNHESVSYILKGLKKAKRDTR